MIEKKHLKGIKAKASKDDISPLFLTQEFQIAKDHQIHGRYDQAISIYSKLLEHYPDNVDILFEMSNIALSFGKVDTAMSLIKKAIAIYPESPFLHNHLGVLLFDQDQYEDAKYHYLEALRYQPDLFLVHNNLGCLLSYEGQIEMAIAHFKQALNLKPDDAAIQSNYLLYLNYHPTLSRSNISNEHLQIGKQFDRFFKIFHFPPEKFNRNRPIKIGYVSPDFKNHPVGRFILPILQNHHQTQVKVYCYADVGAPDHFTHVLQQHATVWRDILGDSHQKVAQLIFEDDIDILIDLAGHTANNRLPMFAQKPAPIQISYLGYPNTTGLSTIDYRLTDHLADPSQYDDTAYSEKLIRLPNAFLCYQPDTDMPKSSEPPVLKHGVITFGCFNIITKINTTVIDIWSNLLSRIPNSRLVIKSKTLGVKSVKDQFLSYFQDRGISKDRIICYSYLPSYHDHLALYNTIDIALDTFPYNGTTTTCEALIMGVPVITFTGDRHTSCVGASLLSIIGLNDCIADSQESYVKIAETLSKDLDLLCHLRHHLRQIVLNSPLCDAKTFVHHLETHYFKIWQLCCESYFDQNSNYDQSLIKESESQSNMIIEHTDSAIDAYNKGIEYYNQKDYLSAIDCFNRAIALQANFAEAYYNLAYTLEDINQWDQAISAYQKAIAIKPNYADAYANLGILMKQKGWLEDSQWCFEKAVLYDPNHVEAHNNLAIALLLIGELKSGFKEYLWRFKRPDYEKREFPFPQWDGSDLTGKHILIYSEQGFGDCIHFIRYVQLIKKQNTVIYVETYRALLTLFSNIPEIDHLIERGAPISSCDYYIPMLSLPYICQTKIDTIPNQVPYLFAPHHCKKDIHQLLSPHHDNFCIGIVWGGNPTNPLEADRSCVLSFFKPISHIPNITLFSLQKGPRRDEIFDHPDMNLIDCHDVITDFSDTAAIIQHMDLIISIETAVAHLAGAMGKPVWLLVSAIPDWRWLIGKTNSPWYPTMTLYRQPTINDWHSVFDQIQNALPHLIVEALKNKGMILESQGQYHHACLALTKSLSIRPNCAETHNELGLTLLSMGQLDQAADHLFKAIDIRPDYSEAWNHMGLVFMHQNHLNQAMQMFTTAIQKNPDNAVAMNNLAGVYGKMNRLCDALDMYTLALKKDPDNAMVHDNIAGVLEKLGNIEQAITHRKQAITLQPDYHDAISNLLYSFNYHPDFDNQKIFTEHVTQMDALQNCSHLKPQSIAHKMPHSLIRIGYISPNFCRHSVAYFMEPILKNHDPKKFKVYGYSDVLYPDTITKRFASYTYQWRHINGISHDQVSKIIQQDQIDILIDLAGHTADNRMPVFARKPAPVQVTYLGYPNTTGLADMDYRMTDYWADPLDTLQPFREKLIRIERCFLCYAPFQDAPQPDISNRTDQIVFGSFNNSQKLNTKVISVWSRILNQVPNSILVLKDRLFIDQAVQKFFLDEFLKHGIDTHQIKFQNRVDSLRDHLACYHQIDIALDPFPYNGTTTTCESLWMGVPVITCAGDRHSSRVGASILTAIQMNQWIAHSIEDYIAKAVQYSQDKTELIRLRHALRTQMLESQLLDEQDMIYHVEKSYFEVL